jgi:F-type H+-transporting ATPase subunit b
MKLLMSIFAQIGINRTFYIQFVLVFVVYFFLSKFMFRPLLMILISRKHKTNGLRRMGEDVLMETDKIQEEYNEKWKTYEDEAYRIRDKINENTSKQCKNLIKEANKKAARVIEDRRTQIAVDMSDIEKKLEKDIPAFSEDISNKLIGGKA